MDAQAWRIVSPEEQERIDAIVRKAAVVLRGAGFDAYPPRFPFAMHHERMGARLREGGFKPKHSDIAFLLNAWASEREFAEAYAWQAVSVAVDAMEAKTGLPAPASLRQEAAAACGGEPFEPWARARLRA